MSPKKNDPWIAALTDVLSERRAELLGRHGDLDRLRAFASGNLAEDEADEVRELLALHPEMAVALEEAGEPPAYGPGHGAHLSAQEQEAGLRDLATRLGLETRDAVPPPARRISWRMVAAVAAGLGAIAVALALQLGSGVPPEYSVIPPNPQPRGGASAARATTIAPQGDEYWLALELPRSAKTTDRYRVVVYEVASKREVWAEEGLAAVAGDRLPVRIPRSRLSAQDYRFHVERTRLDGPGEPIASYSLRVP